MEKFKKFKKEIKSFIEKEFKNEKYFCIVYGSYAWNLNNKKSDVDLILVCEKKTPKKINALVNKILDLHKELKLNVDCEVPHKLKALADFKYLKAALNGKGFILKKGRMIIPPVVKNKSFLHSKKVVLRLLLNAMTSKNKFICGNKAIFSKEKVKAFRALVRIYLLIFPTKKITVNKIVNNLLGKGKQTGEMFLGYKPYPIVKKYLKREIGKTLEKLKKENKILKENNYFLLKDKRWLNEISR